MKGRALYRLAVTLRGEASVYQRLESLKTLQQLSTEEVLDFQQVLLARTLTMASERIPYYRGRVPETPVTSSNAAARLGEFPILEKAVLQNQMSQLRNQDWHKGFVAKTTGGSTGRPVTVHKNPEAIAQEMAATWMGLGWFGMAFGDRCVRFWGQPVGNLRRRLRYLAADAAVSRKTLSAFGYRRSDLASYVRAIENFRPSYLYGYVSALEDLGRFMLAEGIRLRHSHLKAVVTTSEVLSQPQRKAIQSAFGVPVQNEYGCGEVGAIAYECRDGALHLLPTNQFVEIVDEGGIAVPSGETGHIVITDLTNEVMPLIRYRVGDLGRFGDPCGCGCSFPTLAEICGREYDFIDAPDGRRYHGEFFMYVFEDLRRSAPEIGQFQVVQSAPTSLTARVVLDDQARASVVAGAIQTELSKRLPEFKCTVEFVSSLSRRPSGKMRVVENQLRERVTVG